MYIHLISLFKAETKSKEVERTAVVHNNPPPIRNERAQFSHDTTLVQDQFLVPTLPYTVKDSIPASKNNRQTSKIAQISNQRESRRSQQVNNFLLGKTLIKFFRLRSKNNENFKRILIQEIRIGNFFQ